MEWGGPSALGSAYAETWASGPGWYGFGPLALTDMAMERCPTQVLLADCSHGRVEGKCCPANNCPIF